MDEQNTLRLCVEGSAGMSYEPSAEEVEDMGGGMVTLSRFIGMGTNAGLAHSINVNDEDGYNLYVNVNGAFAPMVKFLTEVKKYIGTAFQVTVTEGTPTPEQVFILDSLRTAGFSVNF